MDEKEYFDQLIKAAMQNLTDTPPESPSEFDIYADTNYNLYMFIKGEWTNIGLNVTPLS